MTDNIKKQAEELLEYLKEFSDTNWYCCTEQLLSALNESERSVGLLQETEEGLRAGILDLATLCGCEDEPRLKWIRCHMVNLQNKLSSCEQELTEIVIKFNNKCDDLAESEQREREQANKIYELEKEVDSYHNTFVQPTAQYMRMKQELSAKGKALKDAVNMLGALQPLLGMPADQEKEIQRLRDALSLIAYDNNVHMFNGRMKFINIAKSALERKPE